MSASSGVRLAALLAEDDPDIAEIALLIAAQADPGLDLDACLARIDALAEDARELGGTADAVVVTLRATGLQGDLTEYDDPRNAFLHTALERGRGLPITLSVLTLAVAARVGVAMYGVGMPGHFVVAEADDPRRYWDPFSGWAVLTEFDCARIVTRITGAPFTPAMLAPAEPAAITARMLANLRASYLRRRMLRDALWTTELGLVVEPHSPSLARELPALLAAVGRYRDAERVATAYRADHPGASDRRAVEELIAAVRELQGRMN